jgi:hypothetical protein
MFSRSLTRHTTPARGCRPESACRTSRKRRRGRLWQPQPYACCSRRVTQTGATDFRAARPLGRPSIGGWPAGLRHRYSCQHGSSGSHREMSQSSARRVARQATDSFRERPGLPPRPFLCGTARFQKWPRANRTRPRRTRTLFTVWPATTVTKSPDSGAAKGRPHRGGDDDRRGGEWVEGALRKLGRIRVALIEEIAASGPSGTN